MNNETEPSHVEPLIVNASGIESGGTIMGAPPIELDEEAMLAALYRMERRQSRAIKKLREKAAKKTKRTAKNSRRRNHQ